MGRRARHVFLHHRPIAVPRERLRAAIPTSATVYWYLGCENPSRTHASYFSCARSAGAILGDHMSIRLQHLSRVRYALTLLAFAAFSACHRSPPATNPDETASEPSTIEFQNESLAQADVYVAASSSGARRIGTVFAGRTETLTIPRDIAMRGTVTVVARLLARTRIPSTGSIAISPGTHLSVRLPLDEKALYVLPGN